MEPIIALVVLFLLGSKKPAEPVTSAPADLPQRPPAPAAPTASTDPLAPPAPPAPSDIWLFKKHAQASAVQTESKPKPKGGWWAKVAAEGNVQTDKIPGTYYTLLDGTISQDVHKYIGTTLSGKQVVFVRDDSKAGGMTLSVHVVGGTAKKPATYTLPGRWFQAA